MKTNITVFEQFIETVSEGLYLIDHLQEVAIGDICTQYLLSSILHQLILLLNNNTRLWWSSETRRLQYFIADRKLLSVWLISYFMLKELLLTH